MGRLTILLLTLTAGAAPLLGQSPAAALLRWPAPERLTHRFEILDSSTVVGTKPGLAELRHAITQRVSLIPVACPATTPHPCGHVGVQFDWLSSATSMDSGRTYRTSPNWASADTTVVALSTDGIWSEVANGTRTAAGASVETLMSLGLVRLPQDSVRAGDHWPVEVIFGRMTKPFGLLQSFFAGVVRVDSLTPGRAWLTLEGRDSSDASAAEPMLSSVRSAIIWDTTHGGILESVTTEVIVAPRSGTTICNHRQARRLPEASGTKPAT